MRRAPGDPPARRHRGSSRDRRHPAAKCARPARTRSDSTDPVAPARRGRVGDQQLPLGRRQWPGQRLVRRAALPARGRPPERRTSARRARRADAADAPGLRFGPPGRAPDAAAAGLPRLRSLSSRLAGARPPPRAGGRGRRRPATSGRAGAVSRAARPGLCAGGPRDRLGAAAAVRPRVRRAAVVRRRACGGIAAGLRRGRPGRRA